MRITLSLEEAGQLKELCNLIEDSIELTNEQKRADLMEKLKKEREESKIERRGFRR